MTIRYRAKWLSRWGLNIFKSGTYGFDILLPKTKG